jgi:uncharacterized protein (TIGR03067 family)
MTRLGCIGLMVASVHLGLASTARGQEATDDALLGDWDIVGMVYRGKVQDFGGPTGGTVKIGDGKLWLQYPSFAGGPDEKRITVRPSKKPHEIDLFIAGDKRVWPGIYEVKDGTLRIIMAQSGDARPTDFDAEKNERLTMYTLAKRKK